MTSELIEIKLIVTFLFLYLRVTATCGLCPCRPQSRLDVLAEV
jgi:hypothetical protein